MTLVLRELLPAHRTLVPAPGAVDDDASVGEGAQSIAGFAIFRF